MKKSSKIILTTALAVGITGAAFAFGSHHYISNMSMQEKSEMFSHHFGNKLDLNEAQQLNLTALTGRAAELMQGVRNDHQSRDEMIEQILSDQPVDQSALLQKINRKTDMVNEHAPEMVSLLAGFVDSLDAEQKAELKQMIEKRRSHRMGPRFGKHRDMD